jgi:hypothetical protein
MAIVVIVTAMIVTMTTTMDGSPASGARPGTMRIAMIGTVTIEAAVKIATDAMDETIETTVMIDTAEMYVYVLIV